MTVRVLLRLFSWPAVAAIAWLARYHPRQYWLLKEKGTPVSIALVFAVCTASFLSIKNIGPSADGVLLLLALILYSPASALLSRQNRKIFDSLAKRGEKSIGG